MREVKLTVDRLKFYYERLKDFDIVFNEFVKTEDDFINQFVRQGSDGEIIPTGLIWQVDDVGILFLTHIRPAYEAIAHFNFWDQRFRGREDLCRLMLGHIFEEYEFHRIVAEVGVYSPGSLAAVKRIGFTEEGRKRKATLYKPKDEDEPSWYDVVLFSILEDEV